jgi:hypothetical protein
MKHTVKAKKLALNKVRELLYDIDNDMITRELTYRLMDLRIDITWLILSNAHKNEVYSLTV